MKEPMAVPDYRSRMDFTGRAFIVLGAGEGIGVQISHALAQCGASLLCVDLDHERAERIAGKVGGHPFTANVTEPAQIEAVFREAKAKFGTVSGLVDVIGAARIKPLEELKEDEVTWQFDIVYRHVLYAIQSAARHMTDGGTLAFVSSLSADRYVQNQVLYGSAKAALNQLVRGAAAELGSQGIRVNAVAPGFIRTPRMLDLLPAEAWDDLDGLVPTGRSADPSEIAAALLFLSSNLASHVNGAILPVDGGMSVKSALPAAKFGAASRG